VGLSAREGLVRERSCHGWAARAGTQSASSALCWLRSDGTHRRAPGRAPLSKPPSGRHACTQKAMRKRQRQGVMQWIGRRSRDCSEFRHDAANCDTYVLRSLLPILGNRNFLLRFPLVSGDNSFGIALASCWWCPVGSIALAGLRWTGNLSYPESHSERPRGSSMARKSSRAAAGGSCRSGSSKDPRRLATRLAASRIQSARRGIFRGLVHEDTAAPAVGAKDSAVCAGSCVRIICVQSAGF
jgi:hypothetical protein